MNSTKPAANARTPALHAPAAPQATPGKPAPATQAITGAKRQRAYRLRSKRAVIEAIGYETSASRVTLLALLGQALALLDDETASSRHGPSRNCARRVMRTLVTRYGIDLED